MDFVRWARELAGSIAPETVAPGFMERLLVAAAPTEARPERTIAAPYYLTDLGVRSFEDPARFLSLHADALEWQLPSAEESARLLLALPIADLADHLDAFVLLTGDYDTAAAAVRAREAEIAGSGLHRLQLFAGVLMAAVGDVCCRRLLDAAAVAAHAPTDMFMARHRRAAAEIKRFGSARTGLTMLDELDRQMAGATQGQALSDGDLRALLSVTANLRALAFLMLKDWARAEAEIARSRELATLTDLRAVRLEESSRYAAQENINLAQMLIKDGDGARAVTTLEENVEFCREHAADYLSEALSALAYAQFLHGEHRVAARTAAEAASRVAEEASPVRLQVAREIRIAALAGAGDSGGAAEELHRMERDPLGLELSRADVLAAARSSDVPNATRR